MRRKHNRHHNRRLQDRRMTAWSCHRCRWNHRVSRGPSRRKSNLWQRFLRELQPRMLMFRRPPRPRIMRRLLRRVGPIRVHPLQIQRIRVRRIRVLPIRVHPLQIQRIPVPPIQVHPILSDRPSLQREVRHPLPKWQALIPTPSSRVIHPHRSDPRWHQAVQKVSRQRTLSPCRARRNKWPQRLP